MSSNLEIYLPASAPDHDSFGKVPDTPMVPGDAVCPVRFGAEVWYNQDWRIETLEQIKPHLSKANILVGFSKSGLGALNIAIDNPGMFQAVIIFDAPLMHQELPPWNTAAFYTQETWEDDLPGNRLAGIEAMTQDTGIIHVGGASFDRDHEAFHALLEAHGIQAAYLSRPHLAHSWESGWLHEAAALLA